MKKPEQFSLAKTTVVILAVFLVIRLSFSLIIFYWDVPQTDDFCFMARMHEYGIGGSIKWWYLNWQGRYLPQLLTNFVLFQYSYFDNMLLYGLFISCLFIFSIYQFVKNVLIRNGYQLRPTEKYIITIFSGILFCLILDFHSDTSTFYWINVSAMYFTGIAFFILGISEMIDNSNNKVSYLFILFSFIYVGCSSEHVGILVLGFLILFYIIQNHFKFLCVEYFNNKKLKLAIVSCFASFLIMYLAPGNTVRLSGTEKPTLVEGLNNVIRFFNIFYFNRLSTNIGYLIFGFLFSFFIGSLIKNSIQINKKEQQIFLITSAITLLYFTIGSIIIFGFLVNYNAPSRAFIHISTLIVLFFSLVGILLGLDSNSKQLIFFNQLILLVVMIYGSTVIYKFKFNLKPTLTYANSVRERLSNINTSKHESGKYILLPKLENTQQNILLDGEMATNENDENLFWINKCMNSAYGINKDHIIIIDTSRNMNPTSKY